MPLLLFWYVTKSFLGIGHVHFLKDDMLVGYLFMFFQQVPEKVVPHVSVAIFQVGIRVMPSVYPSPRMPVTEKKHLLSVLFWGIPELNPDPFATSSYDR